MFYQDETDSPRGIENGSEGPSIDDEILRIDAESLFGYVSMYRIDVQSSLEERNDIHKALGATFPHGSPYSPPNSVTCQFY